MSYGRYTDPVARLPREAFRPSAIFLGIVAVFVVTGWLTWAGVGPVRLSLFFFVAAGWTISLCLHEYSHALVAFKGGDHDVAHRGYLTLNPLKYTHPLLSIVLPLVFVLLGGIGLPGGAVWVNHSSVRSRFVDSLISFAGPATNMLLAVVLILPFTLGAADPAVYLAHVEFWSAVAFLAFLQLSASVLNFIPMPGIDGGNLLYPWLSPQAQRGYNHVAPYGMLLLMALLWSPVINSRFWNLVLWIGGIFGLPQDLAFEGLGLFKFWQF